MGIAASSLTQNNPDPLAGDEFRALYRALALPAETHKVAVAVSGGPDSMALCRLLADSASSLGLGEIHALTVDHKLRPEAAQEAATVGAQVASWPAVHHTVLERAIPKKPGSRILEEARRDRYRLMADYCRQHGIKYLFVAHHLEDQAETLLLRLAGGSGLDGLCAMKPMQPYSDVLTICRPLLAVSKERLVAACESRDISFVADPGNENDTFARPRLRRSTAILAREGLTAKRLAVTAARLLRAREALEHYTAQIWDETCIRNNSDRIVLSFPRILAVPAEIRLRVLDRAWQTVAAAGPDSYGPRREKFEQLAERIFSDRSFRAATLGGVKFSRKRDEVVIEPESR